jgi:hypothetical protein
LVTENTLFGDPEVSSSLQQSNETVSADIPEEEVDFAYLVVNNGVDVFYEGN